MKSVIKKYMRYFVFFRALIVILLFISCKKDLSAGKTSAAIPGKWNVITDSTFAGVGMGNHPVNYTGQAGDYYDFNLDGKLYINENGNSSVLNYNLLSDTTVIIDSFGIMINGVPDTSIITNLTAHSATITTYVISTPGGNFGRKVSLSR